jgi:hypothetical protein
MTTMKNIFVPWLALSLCGVACLAHDTGTVAVLDATPAVQSLKTEVEKKGPVRAPALLKEKIPVSGQGFWKFIAVTNLMPLPAEVVGKVTPAHGTVFVDAERDIVYWGLKKVGWVGFSNQLRDSWVVKGDEQFAHNNLHGADILPRKGKLPLVAAADNEGFKVYLSDTTFLNPKTLSAPTNGPYATNATYRPTDVAFVSANRIFITDGYARGYFMEATTEPLAYVGGFFGGHDFSKTPHGITFDPHDKNLLVSARPEGQLKRWSISGQKVLEIGALPEGTLLCDVDLWDDYALAACLEGPFNSGSTNKTAGPLMVVNLKKKTIASIIRPKAELGYDFCEHIHDACWYFHKRGRATDVYLVFTAWNPGGIGALKLVSVPD